MHRRCVLTGLCATAIAGISPHTRKPAYAQGTEQSDLRATRARVIDVSTDVTSHVGRLKEAGVIAVGRYYGRAAPAGGCLYPSKLLTARELRAIEDAGLAVFTVFQHCASHCDRFRESYRKGIEDASAAVQSAHLLGQPKDTPIYFAVDFNPRSDPSGTEASACKLRDQEQIWRLITDYFRDVSHIVWQAGWKVGVYGAGATCSRLQAERLDGRPLAEYFWLSASIGHMGHSDFFSSGSWHIFQNKIDIKLDYLGSDLEVDTDVTNPKLGDFGQWRRDTLKEHWQRIAPETASMVLSSRAFVRPGPQKCFERLLPSGALEGEVKDPEFKGRTVRIIRQHRTATGAPPVIEASLHEGEKTRVYFFHSESLIVGLERGMP